MTRFRHYTGIYGSDPGREFAADASVGIQKRKMEFFFPIHYLLRHQQSV